MPGSRFIEAERLKPFIGYLAVAFGVILVLGNVVPAGAGRRVLVVGWLVLFPIGAWQVLKGGVNKSA